MNAPLKLPAGLRLDANDAIIITDDGFPQRRILYINPAFARMTGFRSEELLGRNGDLLLADGPMRMETLLWLDSEADGREVHWIAKLHRRDGTLFCAEAQVHRIPIPQGEGERLLLVVSDVTGRVGKHRAATGATGRFDTLETA